MGSMCQKSAIVCSFIYIYNIQCRNMNKWVMSGSNLMEGFDCTESHYYMSPPTTSLLIGKTDHRLSFRNMAIHKWQNYFKIYVGGLGSPMFIIFSIAYSRKQITDFLTGVGLVNTEILTLCVSVHTYAALLPPKVEKHVTPVSSHTKRLGHRNTIRGKWLSCKLWRLHFT